MRSPAPVLLFALAACGDEPPHVPEVRGVLVLESPQPARVELATGDDPTALHRWWSDPSRFEPARAELRERAEFAVPAGHWAFARVTWPGGAVALLRSVNGGTRSSHRLDPRELSNVHVQQLAPDLCAPAGGEIQVTLRTPQGEARDLGRVVVPADGLVTLPALQPGQYTLRTSGIRPGDGAPHLASFRVDNLREDRAVLLVQPPRRLPAEVEVVMADDVRFATAPRLCLRRIDRMRGECTIGREHLAPGSQQIAVHVEAGDYQIDVVPAGIADVDSPDGLLSVTADGGKAARRVHVRGRPATVELRLRGVTEADLPLRVHRLFEDGQFGDPAETQLLGPVQWSGLEQLVPPDSARGCLIAVGRNGVLISDGVVLDREQEIELRPAVRFTFAWAGFRNAADADVLLAVQSGSLRLLLPLRPVLDANGLPVLQAEFAVPPGVFTLEGMRPDGSKAFVEQLTASGREGSARR